MSNVEQNMKGRGLWQDAYRRFKRNKMAVVSMCFLILLTLISVASLIIDAVTSNQFYINNVINMDIANRLAPPSAENIFGLDEFGRSVFFRVLWGTRYSLFMGMLSVAGAAIVGGTLGAIAGFYGGKSDHIVMRLMDVLMAMPAILLAIVIVAALGHGLGNVLIAISIFFVPNFARVVRAAVMTVREQEFIEAADAVGASDFRIIYEHILPNAIAPIIVQVTLGVATAITFIAALSFLGLGIQPPSPEWGAMLASARAHMRDAWHITVIPGLAIMLTILSLNIVGDGLRDALDPKLK
jgi:peptide/nickel transport system permease protein